MTTIFTTKGIDMEFAVPDEEAASCKACLVQAGKDAFWVEGVTATTQEALLDALNANAAAKAACEAHFGIKLP